MCLYACSQGLSQPASDLGLKVGRKFENCCSSETLVSLVHRLEFLLLHTYAFAKWPLSLPQFSKCKAGSTKGVLVGRIAKKCSVECKVTVEMILNSVSQSPLPSGSMSTSSARCCTTLYMCQHSGAP